MLNLKVGGFYAFIYSCGSIPVVGRIASKEAKSDHEHSYLITFPRDTKEIDDQATGMYLRDIGIANRGKYVFSLVSAITECRELSEEESKKMRLWFEYQEARKVCDLKRQNLIVANMY